MNKNNTPFFSVIVPIYKVEEYLHKCITSILDQTCKDFELILVDDGSPDKCPEICDYYKQTDARVSVIHKSNGGLVSARNTGLHAAIGNYICYVDGDDWIDKDLLEVAKTKIESNNMCELFVFAIQKVFENKTETISQGPKEGFYDKEALKKEVYPYMMWDKRQPFCKGLIFPGQNKIYKREFLLKHYCEDERIGMGEDNAFTFETIYFANGVYFSERELYYYNQLNQGSFIHRYDPNRFENNKYLFDYIEKNLSCEDPIIKEQINAFKAYWIMMAVFHEIKSGNKIWPAAKHIKKGIEEYDALKDVNENDLPLRGKIYMILLKKKLYKTTLLMTKIIQLFR